MATEFKLPNLGENVESGDVVSILVSEGDEVSEDQPILELETDKATVEVPSNIRGKITQIHVSEGDNVKVGQVILTVEDGAFAGAEAETAEAEPEEKATEAETKERPEQEKEEQEKEEKEEERPPARGAEPEKPAKAPSRGGEVVDFRERARAEPSTQKDLLIPASPAVRRFAREIGIDISGLSGSGPRGRILIDDVKSYSRQQQSGQAQAAPAIPSAELPDFSKFGQITREPFSNVRRTTARHLSRSWNSIPHVTQHDEADITRLEEMRKQYTPQVEQAGGKLTITSIALKVLVAALKKFPKFNASIDVENEEIIYKQYVHIGVAVDTDRGLLVPVIRDVDQKNVVNLSVELSELAEKARAGKVSLDDLQGGCITVTNLGGIGGTSFTPIVNFPEVAILGISRASVKPVFVDGQFQPRTVLPLSLSYDHRLVDGADAARFLRFVARSFEDPFLLVLEG